jgi:hypothetical protein
MLLVGLVALGERRSPLAEPLRSPAEIWPRLASLVPSGLPLRAR